MTRVLEPIAITGCGVVSAGGIGMDRLTALISGQEKPHDGPVADDDPGGYPPVGMHTVPRFNLAEHLGRRASRRLDRMTGLGILASQEALESGGLRTGAADRQGIGVVVGTTTGSIRSFDMLSTQTLARDRPAIKTPSRFPSIVLNSCAGQIAIWHSLHGINATLAAGNLTGIAALRYGGNAIRRGYAEGALIGGIEELCPQIAWARYRSGLLPPDGVLGEGSAFLLARRDVPGPRHALAQLLAAELGYYGSARPRVSLADGLARHIERALARSGLSAADIDLVSLGSAGWAGGAWAERKGVELALGRMPPMTRIDDLVGECFSAAGAMQAAAILARWRGGGHPAERTALLTSVAGDGNVGCAVLRRYKK